MAYLDLVCPKIQQSLVEVGKENAGMLHRDPVGFLDMLSSQENKAGYGQVRVDEGDGRRKMVEMHYFIPMGESGTFTGQTWNNAAGWNFGPAGPQNGPDANYQSPDYNNTGDWTGPDGDNGPWDPSLSSGAPNPGTVPTNFNDVCAATTEIQPVARRIQVRYTLYGETRLISKANLQQICFASSDEIRAQVIMSQMNAMNIRLNKALQYLMSSQFGNVVPVDGTQSPTIGVPASLITTNVPSSVALNVDALLSGTSPNFFGMAQVLEAYELTGGRRKPLVVGSGDLGLYTRIVGLGCCNDDGIDLSRVNGEILFFRDKYVNRQAGGSALGQGGGANPGANLGGWANTTASAAEQRRTFGVFSPGAVQLLTWNENVGEFKHIGDQFVHDTIVDPISGIEYDFDLVYDPCHKQFQMGLKLHFDLFVLPPNMYPLGSDMEGVNGTFRVLANN